MKKVWLWLCARWQELNRELAESLEKKNLREQNEGLKQHNAALMEQVRVMTQMLNVKGHRQDQDETLKKILNLLNTPRQQPGGYQNDKIKANTHNYEAKGPGFWQVLVDEYKGYYLSSDTEADRELRMICEQVLPGVRPEEQEKAYDYIVSHVKGRCADDLEWTEWPFHEFMGYSGNRTIFETKDGVVHEILTPADEIRPKLVFHVPAAKDHVNAFLAGMQLFNDQECDRIYESCCEAILYGTVTNDWITPEQRTEMRLYIRDAIRLRSRMDHVWNPPFNPEDGQPGQIIQDEADLLPMVNYGGPNGTITTPGGVIKLPADETGEITYTPNQPAGLDERESPCDECETGEMKHTGTDPNGQQHYECTVCGNTNSFP